ncbi:gastrula zinc finger protein xLCGF3.1-like [Macrobrachium nipponense]|uniref:gastrula zinc finger protein xLCGF3.1-like n=1 Tax=Macrobrachium nipponense TaxID=159736 RepID=UPI0030C83764
MESGGHLLLSSIKQENETMEEDLPVVSATDSSSSFMESCIEIKAEPDAQPEFIGPDKIDVKYPCKTSVKLERDPLSFDEEYVKEIKEDVDVQVSETPKDIHEISFVSCGELLEPERPSESCGNGARSRDLALAGKKVFTCSECQRPFTHLSHLKEHMRNHTGEKPFLCTECPSRFSRSSTLKIHLRTHTGEKPYTCAECQSRFLTSSHLRRHMRIHTRENAPRAPVKKKAPRAPVKKSYACTVCESRFPFPYRLKLHMRMHTGRNLSPARSVRAASPAPAPCSNTCALNTGEKPFTCVECQTSFTT